MNTKIKLVATDMDGTFLRNDNTYDIKRFKKIFARMKELDCKFVVASGNQYYQLRDFFPDCHEEISFVAENGAFVKDSTEVIFHADIAQDAVDLVIEVCAQYPEVQYIFCGLESAYGQRGSLNQKYFDFMAIYYHKLKWVDDLKSVDDKCLKFAVSVPDEKTQFFYELFNEKLQGKIIPTTSGHGAIDLILPGCHKAAGLNRLLERWKILPEECVAFGDGGNDIEMLKFCGKSFAVDNAPQNVKNAAKFVCPSNESDGVLVTLEKLFH